MGLFGLFFTKVHPEISPPKKHPGTMVTLMNLQHQHLQKTKMDTVPTMMGLGKGYSV